MSRIVKPKKQESVELWRPRPHLLDMTAAHGYAKFEKASEALAALPGGFQRLVAVRPEDGKFVACVMLWPTEFTPDIINHVQSRGFHVMVGQGSGLTAYQRGEK